MGKDSCGVQMLVNVGESVRSVRKLRKKRPKPKKYALLRIDKCASFLYCANETPKIPNFRYCLRALVFVAFGEVDFLSFIRASYDAAILWHSHPRLRAPHHQHDAAHRRNASFRLGARLRTGNADDGAARRNPSATQPRRTSNQADRRKPSALANPH